jgi:hypothetical protein
VLGTLADGEHVGVAGAQVVVHHDAALDGQPRRLRLVHVGADAAADDHHLRREGAAVLEAQPGDPPVLAQQRRRDLAGQHTDAHRLHLPAQQVGAGGVELLRHQVRGGLDDGDLDLVAEQSAGRFQPQ